MKRHTVNLEDLKTEFLSKEFGWLTVVDVIHDKFYKCVCRCRCGREKIVDIYKLRSGHSVSDETRRKISDDKRIKSLAFTSYKESGGSLSWNDFQRAIKNGSIDMYIYLD